MFKNKIRLGNNFPFKDQIPKDLTPGVVYNFQCGLCDESYYGECVRHLNVRTGEHIGISPLTKKNLLQFLVFNFIPSKNWLWLTVYANV